MDDEAHPQPDKDEYMTIRVSREIKDALADLARRNERTLVGEVRVALKNHIAGTVG